MQRLGVPNGLREVGYTSSDIPALVDGTRAQVHLTTLSPRPADAEALADIRRRAHWLVEPR